MLAAHILQGNWTRQMEMTCTTLRFPLFSTSVLLRDVVHHADKYN